MEITVIKINIKWVDFHWLYVHSVVIENTLDSEHAVRNSNLYSIPYSNINQSIHDICLPHWVRFIWKEDMYNTKTGSTAKVIYINTLSTEADTNDKTFVIFEVTCNVK